GVSKETGAMPTCVYDRGKDVWIDLKAKNLGAMGVGQDTCVYDPEHNVILELIRGVAYRYKEVPVGTRARLGTEEESVADSLRKAVILYASFDEEVRMDFGRGDRTPGTRSVDPADRK